MMLQRDFGCVFNLFRRAAKNGRKAGRGHGSGTSHLGLTAAFRA